MKKPLTTTTILYIRTRDITMQTTNGIPGENRRAAIADAAAN